MRLVISAARRAPLSASDAARVEALVRRGGAEADAGRLADAEATLRRALAESRDSGSRAELSALQALSTMCAHQGRESELVPLARRMIAVADEEGGARSMCAARQAMSMAFANVEDWDRTLRSLPDLDAAIARCADDERLPFEINARSMRASSLFEVGDVDGAETELVRVDEAAARGAPSVWWRLSRTVLDARLHLVRGRPPEALRAARRAISLAPSFVAGIDAHVIEVEAALACEGDASAVAAARRVMEVVDAAGAELPSPSLVVHAFAGLGRLLHESCDALDDARRAYDLAAAAVLRRVVQIEHSLHDLPEMVVRDPDDAAALAQFRTRFQDQRRTLLDSVGRLLRAEAAAGRPVAFASNAESGWVAICAWCLRIRPDGGSWVAVGHFVPAHDDWLRVTHGICGECLAGVAAG